MRGLHIIDVDEKGMVDMGRDWVAQVAGKINFVESK